MPDAVVVGAGPNGLVGANLLADAGWDVVVLEARARARRRRAQRRDRAAGLRPRPLQRPSIRSASPRRTWWRMDLEAHGVRWRRQPIAVAHPARGRQRGATSPPTSTRRARRSTRSRRATATRWRDFHGLWERVGDALLEALLSPFPPRARRRAAGAVARRAPTPCSTSPASACCPCGGWRRRSSAAPAPRGCSPATRCTPTSRPSRRAAASTASSCAGSRSRSASRCPRAAPGGSPRRSCGGCEARGGRVRCGERVAQVVVARRAGPRRADRGGPRGAGGARGPGRRRRAAALPRPARRTCRCRARLEAALRRFQYDQGTVRVAWALREPDARGSRSPSAAPARCTSPRASTRSRRPWRRSPAGSSPPHPFLVAGQYALADPTRQPEGCETFWGYAHVPRDGPRRRRRRGHRRGAGTSATASASPTAWSARSRRVAPGFRDRILDRDVAAPPQLEADEREPRRRRDQRRHRAAAPAARLPPRARPRPARRRRCAGLFLASASAHPGGGVHGACGANAARAALRERGPARRATARAEPRAVAGRGRP